MRSLFVNVFGAPGSGKSTMASYIFSQLKMKNINCELVTEFAKDLVWYERHDVFSKPENQFFIGANQFFKLNSMDGKVDVVITDSPILLSMVYNSSELLGEEYNAMVLRMQSFFGGINILVCRQHNLYDPNGRNETVEESDLIHRKIKKILDDNYKYYTSDRSIDSYDLIINKIMEAIK